MQLLGRITAVCMPAVEKKKSSNLLLVLARGRRGRSKRGRWEVRCEEVKEKGRRNIQWSLDLVKTVNEIAEWADDVKARGMKQRRRLYTHDDWLKHRSSKRHVRHLLSSLSSVVILSLVPPMCLVTAIAVAVASYNSAVTGAWLPAWLPLLHSPTLPYELTAPALALLLVFRTEASYARYDDGRKTWTRVISCTKDLARLCICSHSHSHIHIHELHLQRLLYSYILAFPVALKCHVTYGSDVKEELREVLSGDDLAMVVGSGHPPNCIIHLMTVVLLQMQTQGQNQNQNQRQRQREGLRCCHSSNSRGGWQEAMDARVAELNESVSVVEKLMRSPIPLSYTRLTTRFLVLWHLTLPVVLWDSCHWMVVPATLFSAISLFCIEEVGVLIEEPFPILALDKMCSLLHHDVRRMAHMQPHIHAHILSHSHSHKLNSLSLNLNLNSSPDINRDSDLDLDVDLELDVDTRVSASTSASASHPNGRVRQTDAPWPWSSL